MTRRAAGETMRGLGTIVAMLIVLASAPAWAQSKDASPQPEDERPAGRAPEGRAPAQSERADVWGALAFTADGSWATAWSQPTKSDAESNVMTKCGKFRRGECKVVSFTGKYCAALATYIGHHSRRSYKLSFTAGGTSLPEAQRAAMDRCNDDARTRGKCQLRAMVCGDGR
jgi:hypothetical protein